MRFLILISLAFFMLASPAFSQTVSTDPQERPVSRREVRRWLTLTQDNVELSAEANRDLIAEIERRGVDFILSAEEEWSFTLLEASPQLLETIRLAVPAEFRRQILDQRAKHDLFNAFITNYRLGDIQSRRSALDAGREFVRRFAADPSVRQQVDLINRNLLQLTNSILMMERGVRIRTN